MMMELGSTVTVLRQIALMSGHLRQHEVKLAKNRGIVKLWGGMVGLVVRSSWR